MQKRARGVEPIMYQRTEIACVYRASIQVSDRLFLTPDANAFHIGIHERKKGTSIPAHIHNCPIALEISEIQEFLYIVSGSVKITLLTETLETIATKILRAGDSILLKTQAHRVEFLDHARIIELKQGPYPGKAYAKKFLE